MVLALRADLRNLPLGRQTGCQLLRPFFSAEVAQSGVEWVAICRTRWTAYGGLPPVTRNIAARVDAFSFTMTKKLLFVSTFLLALSFAAFAADVTGKWVADVQGRNGNTTHMTFTLKADGANLTGNVLGGGGRRGGGGGGGAAPAANDISNGKIDGDKVSFEVKRSFNGNESVTKYEGTVSGDSLNLKETRNGQNGPTTRDIAAKRSTT
jgi:hypothetical protein